MIKKIFLFVAILCFSSICTGTSNPTDLQISVLFVDITHPKILSEDHPNKRLIPASVTKLFVANAALKQFGSAYSFATPIYIRGQLDQGILKGDLILYGVGDPMLINERIEELTTILHKSGIKEIHGNIVINNSYFGLIKPNDPDRLKAKTNSAEGYNGLLSSSGSNFGTISVSVTPAKQEGQPAIINLIPGTLDNTILTGRVMTSNDTAKPLKLVRESKNFKELLQISGRVPTKAPPIFIYRSAGYPDLATGAVLKYFLQQAGISITGSIQVESTPLKQNDQLLLQEYNHPLSETISAMLIYSNNYIADMLTLDLWQHEHHASRISLAQASNHLLDDYDKMKSHSVFTTKNASLPILMSGSGLTTTNRLSALDLVILLEGMHKDTSNFPIFYSALTIPGQSSDWRHIKTSEHPWMNRVNVKTGSLSDPVLVYSLAGYFRMKNGDLGAFAILLNQPGTNRAGIEHQLVSRLDKFFASH